MNLFVARFSGNSTTVRDTLKDVHDYYTDKGELYIEFRPDDPTPIIYACRQWLSVTPDFTDAVEHRRDRHNPNEDSNTDEKRPNRRRGNPNRYDGGQRPAGSRKSDMEDYTIVLPDDVERRRAASVEFAIDNQTVPWSEAHMRALKEFEAAVAEEHGWDAVGRLPWNNIPRGEQAKQRQ